MWSTLESLVAPQILFNTQNLRAYMFEACSDTYLSFAQILKNTESLCHVSLPLSSSDNSRLRLNERAFQTPFMTELITNYTSGWREPQHNAGPLLF